MPDPPHIGTVTYLEQEASERWTVTGGWTQVRTWTGLVTKVDAFVKDSIPDGYVSISIERTDSAAKVTAEYPKTGLINTEGGNTYSADPITRTWQVVGTREEASIWTHPMVVLEFRDYIESQYRGPIVRWINDCIDYGLSVEQAFPSNGTPIIPAASSKAPNRTLPPFNAIAIGRISIFASPVLAELYERLLINRDAYPLNKYVLRKVETIGTYSQLKAAHANVGRLLTMAQLLSSEPSITKDVQVEIKAAALTKFYWYKNVPQIEPIQNGRRQMTQEYEGFAYFDNFLHLKMGEKDYPTIDIIAPRLKR